jgi:hypothetical protein
MLLVVRAKRHERDYELDEVIMRTSSRSCLSATNVLSDAHACHGPIVSNAPIPNLPALAPEREVRPIPDGRPARTNRDACSSPDLSRNGGFVPFAFREPEFT